jgi:hypothetical protein
MTETLTVSDYVHVELLKIAGELQATNGKAKSAQDAVEWLVERWQQPTKPTPFQCPHCGELLGDLHDPEIVDKIHEHVPKCLGNKPSTTKPVIR